jgi:hypothetical protein
VKDEDATYSDEETARRRDDAIRRTLNTPPKPLKAYVGKRAAKKVTNAKPRGAPKKAG